MTVLGWWGGGGGSSPSPLILDQVQGSEVFLALSIWQKCPVWDTKTSIKFLAAQEISKTLHYSRLYYRHKIKSPLIRSENFLNIIQNGLIKERKKPKRLQVQRKHELSKVVLEGESNQKHNGASKERWCGSWTSVKFYVCARVHTLPLFYLCALKIRYSGNPPLVKSYRALGFLWISWAWLTLSP